MLSVGMRSLDFTNRGLEYTQAAILPFFVLHQPVIMTIAFFVVQWQASIAVKLVTVVLSSFVVTLALYELVIRRVGFLTQGIRDEGLRAKCPSSSSVDHRLYQTNTISI